MSKYFIDKKNKLDVVVGEEEEEEEGGRKKKWIFVTATHYQVPYIIKEVKIYFW